MQTIYFATTNQDKLLIAKKICANSDIALKPVTLEIDEIQGEDPELIVRDKAQRAFALFGKPIVVTDDSWNIRALRGFPGPYMKSINQWFTADDFLRLMEGIEDRTITLHQYLAYTDGKVVKIFRNDSIGKVTHTARGSNPKSPSVTVTALDSDNGKTIAEVFEQGVEALQERHKNRTEAWHDFIAWYQKNND